MFLTFKETAFVVFAAFVEIFHKQHRGEVLRWSLLPTPTLTLVYSDTYQSIAHVYKYFTTPMTIVTHLHGGLVTSTVRVSIGSRDRQIDNHFVASLSLTFMQGIIRMTIGIDSSCY